MTQTPTPTDTPDTSDTQLRTIPPRLSGPLGRVQAMLESPLFQRIIIGLIALNAAILGLETSPTVMAAAGDILIMLDRGLLAVFVAELVLKLIVYRTRFHHDPWNLFDAVVIGIALTPSSGALSVLRALRILRVLRLISAVPSMRRVVSALLLSIPGIGSILGLLSLVFYVFAVMATKLFGAEFADWFGTIGRSAYTLFQVMTLESWSMGIVRPVMELFPLAWVFFLAFILMTTFTVLNLFIGVVVDALQRQHEAEAQDRNPDTPDPARVQAELLAEMRQLRAELQELKQQRPDQTPV